MSKAESNLKPRKPNIIFWDIETAPLVLTSWGLYPKSLSHETILQDWFIICAAWKSAGSDKVHSITIKDAIPDDYEVVKKLGEMVRTADVIVHHNGDKFDLKKLNARLIFHRLPPIPFVPTVDTLKEVRKIAAFPSNRLDYLTKTLIGRGKDHTSSDLWMRVIKGDRSAVRDMNAYCKTDVIRLEEFYDVLRPYMKAHPHVGALSNKNRLLTCPKCGGDHMTRNGTRVTATGMKKAEMQCQDCGSYHRVPLTKLQNR